LQSIAAPLPAGRWRLLKRHSHRRAQITTEPAKRGAGVKVPDVVIAGRQAEK
jgi:hypothetical protein